MVPMSAAVRTACFGGLETIQVPDQAVLTFPEGLPGFEEHRAFALIDDDRLGEFHWLQSLDDPDAGFLVLEPSEFVADYAFDLPDDVAAALGLDETVQPRVLVILAIPGDIRAMTANLRAPLVINVQSRVGKQVILADDRYALRHPVFGPSAGETA
jgi:flagellar assembly factor FliW